MILETKIYQKEQNLSVVRLFKESLKDLYDSRFLSRQLAVRDIQAQYRQSYLGIFWALIMPLTTAFVWIFLNQSGMIQLTDTGIPYPVYAFAGTLIWTILVEAINMPTKVTNGAKSILTKINFPKEALIVSGVYKLLFNSMVKVILLLVFLVVYGVGFHWSLLLFPFALFVVVLFGVTIGLFITPIGLLYTDIAKIITMGLGFLMYATPVVYAIPKTGIMKTIMEWNPLTPLIVTTRDLVVGTRPDFLYYFYGIFLISVPFLIIALLIYRISIPIIVERLNS